MPPFISTRPPEMPETATQNTALWSLVETRGTVAARNARSRWSHMPCKTSFDRPRITTCVTRDSIMMSTSTQRVVRFCECPVVASLLMYPAPGHGKVHLLCRLSSCLTVGTRASYTWSNQERGLGTDQDIRSCVASAAVRPLKY